MDDIAVQFFSTSEHNCLLSWPPLYLGSPIRLCLPGDFVIEIQVLGGVASIGLDGEEQIGQFVSMLLFFR
jgi:hypothetical protein